MAEAIVLPTLYAAGFSATVDAFAAEPRTAPDQPSWSLWFLSLLGSPQAVRALWARLLKGEPATLTPEAEGSVRFCELAPMGPRGWRFFSSSLPAAGGYQGVLVPDVARFAADRLEFVLLPRHADEVAALHYRFLNRRLDLPLHPGWAGWLWERALRTGEARALDALGVAAYRCVPDPDGLTAELSVAVRRGTLDVPDTHELRAGQEDDDAAA